MNSIEFKALAKDGDFTRVIISRNRDARITVSAILICDEESQGLTAYNYLRDGSGNIAKFDNADEAVEVIRASGYKGQICVAGLSEKAGKAERTLWG